MKILVDRYMASVGSKHRATTIRPACAAMTPRAARWISSEMAQKQHAAPRATALLEFHQNDGKTGASCERPACPFSVNPLRGVAKRRLVHLLRIPAHAPPIRGAIDRMRGAAPDHPHDTRIDLGIYG
ncbi:hypothetical protein K8353_11635 [Burkholderia contaminans]|nr:hypothetical protein [Burkholderia contaminans]